MNTLLKVENVIKNYGDFRALNKVSLDVPKKSIFGLLCLNGAGKTTLIRIINQITGPDGGQIYLDGEKLKPNHIAAIGYLPEERGLYKNMKVGEQAIYLAQLKGLSKSEAVSKLKMWFDKFEISNWWGKKVQELSKGMAQKVQFIVTVLHEPKLLIFDEPFSGFDPINANLIRDEILALRDDGATIIFSTHRMESVEEVCDHIALINKSNKLLEGKLVDIKKQYKTNTYEVGLIADNLDILKAEISDKFDVQPAEFKSLNHDLKLNIKLSEKETSNDLLNYLGGKAQINHFVELVPSANDIFIQAIKNNIHA